MSPLLGDLVEVNPRTPQSKANPPAARIALADIDERFGTVVPRRQPGGQADRENGRVALPGDVLFARISPSMENGKVAIMPLEGGPALVSRELFVLRAKEETDPRMFWAYLRQDAVRARLRQGLVGSGGRQRLREVVLAQLEVPSPRGPWSSARAVLERLDSARILRARVSDRLAAFAGAAGAALAAEAPRVALFDLALEVGPGTGERTAERGEVPVIRAANLVDGVLEGPMRYLAEPSGGAPLLRVGDILLTRRGSRKRVGNVAVYEGEPPLATHASYLIRIRVPGTGSGLLWAWLQSAEARSLLLRRAEEGSRGFDLSTAAIQELKVPKAAPEVEARGAAVAELARRLTATSRAQFDLLGAAVQAHLRQVFAEGDERPLEVAEVDLPGQAPRPGEPLSKLFAAATRRQRSAWEAVSRLPGSFGVFDLGVAEGEMAQTQHSLALLEQLGVLVSEENDGVQRWRRPDPDLDLLP